MLISITFPILLAIKVDILRAQKAQFSWNFSLLNIFQNATFSASPFSKCILLSFLKESLLCHTDEVILAASIEIFPFINGIILSSYQKILKAFKAIVRCVRLLTE